MRSAKGLLPIRCCLPTFIPVGGSYTNETPVKHIRTSFKVKANE